MVTLQACAAAMLEEYLDEWQTALEADMKKEGYYIRPRFSPGYGDFDIAHQDMILRMLDTAKKIGQRLPAISKVVRRVRRKTAHTADHKIQERG